MIPIYFPFTFIPESIAEVFYSAFGGAIVYQPTDHRISQKTVKSLRSEFVEFRAPIKGDEERIASLYKNYHSWGALHVGGIGTFKDSANVNADDDETFVSQIRSRILKNSVQVLPEPDDVCSDRLFLQMAEDFDRNQYEIDRDLKLSEEKKLLMHSFLDGRQTGASGRDDYLPVQDYGVYLTQKRIRAWMRLYAADADAPPFLITNSPSSFNQLIEYAPVWNEVCSWEGRPENDDNKNNRKRIDDYLKYLIQASMPVNHTEKFSIVQTEARQRFRLRIGVLPDVSPDRLIADILGGVRLDRRFDRRYPNTVVGVLEIIN